MACAKHPILACYSFTQPAFSCRLKLTTHYLIRTPNRASGLMSRGGPQQAAAQGLPANWTDTDDDLLCALVADFEKNWAFIAEVLSTTSALQGITRRADFVKVRGAQALWLVQMGMACAGLALSAVLCCREVIACCASASRRRWLSWLMDCVFAVGKMVGKDYMTLYHWVASTFQYHLCSWWFASLPPPVPWSCCFFLPHTIVTASVACPSTHLVLPLLPSAHRHAMASWPRCPWIRRSPGRRPTSWTPTAPPSHGRP